MIKKLPVLLIACLLFFSCGKVEDAVPSVPVRFTIAKADPRITALNSQGGVVLISGVGVAGIIIYRSIDGRYLAYDRCSSYQPKNLCAVVPDDNAFTVTDPCSGSKFSLSDGGPVKAPATRSLRIYGVNETQFEINVYN
jgi:nitrite reductase/ring-hydroxylating ferredoxin subunit